MDIKSIRTWEQDGKWNAEFTHPDRVLIVGAADTEAAAVDELVTYQVGLYAERCNELNSIRRVLGIGTDAPATG